MFDEDIRVAIILPGDTGQAKAVVEPHVQRFSLSFEYPVYFTEHVFNPTNDTLARALCHGGNVGRQRVGVFVDSGVTDTWPDIVGAVESYAAAHGDQMELAAVPEIVPGGERVKTDPALVERCQKRLMEMSIDRHSYVMVVGGGAVLDMMGYVAATTHRGVRLIRVPTTVLSQNDSGIGVKNGVNAFGLKNFLGTFAPPHAVINDLGFIATLDDRDKRAGMAEAIKIALIRDSAFFSWLEENAAALARFDVAAMAPMIRRCAELHMAHIATSGDPFEQGSARPLDYGHWAAHKIESLTDYALRHGEAVAIGLALDTRYSVLIGMLDEADGDRVWRLLSRLGFGLWHDCMAHTGADGTLRLLSGLREFQEHLGGELTVTLLTDIGIGTEVHEIDETLVIAALDTLKRLDGNA